MSEDAKQKKEPAEQKKEPAEQKKEPAKKTEKAKKELPKNCVACNKAFKNKRWYYKNGKYFCRKRCWKKFEQDRKNEKAKAAKEVQEKKAKEKETAEKAATEGDQKKS